MSSEGLYQELFPAYAVQPPSCSASNESDFMVIFPSAELFDPELTTKFSPQGERKQFDF